MTSSRPLGLFLAFCWIASAADLQLFEAVEPHMGTLVRIKLYARDGEQALLLDGRIELDLGVFQSRQSLVGGVGDGGSVCDPRSRVGKNAVEALDRPAL